MCREALQMPPTPEKQEPSQRPEQRGTSCTWKRVQHSTACKHFSRLSFGSFTLRTGRGMSEFLHSFFKGAEPNLGVKRVQQCHTVSKQQMRPRTKLSVKYLAHKTFESISLSDLETRVPSRLATPWVCSGHGLTSGHLSYSSSVGGEQKPHKEKDPFGSLSCSRCHFHQERAWGEIPVMATMKF